MELVSLCVLCQHVSCVYYCCFVGCWLRERCFARDGCASLAASRPRASRAVQHSGCSPPRHRVVEVLAGPVMLVLRKTGTNYMSGFSPTPMREII
jgi:hypothetical protein